MKNMNHDFYQTTISVVVKWDMIGSDMQYSGMTGFEQDLVM